MHPEEEPWVFQRPSPLLILRPSSTPPKQWVENVGTGKVLVATTDGVVALAVLDLLALHMGRPPALSGPWLERQGGEQVALQILSGLRGPNAAEANSLLEASETAGSLGFLISNRMRWFQELQRDGRLPEELTRLDMQSAGMTHVAHEHRIPIRAPLDEGGISPNAWSNELAEELRQDVESADGDWISYENPPQLFTLTARRQGKKVVYETRPSTTAPMSIRQMVRAIVERNHGTPITSREIREHVWRDYDVGLPSRSIDQAIAGLRRDGELRTLARATHVATKRLGHRPYPTDPTRRRARP